MCAFSVYLIGLFQNGFPLAYVHSDKESYLSLRQAFVFPLNAGFSIGMEDDPTFVVMETHFDNLKYHTRKYATIISLSRYVVVCII